MSEDTGKTLLLVEDEAILAMTEKLQLENYGYTVRTVTTGEQAVEAVKTFPGIDLVLMDINLGDGMDGTQAAEIILEEHDIPIVFVSSHSEREIVEKTEKITSYGYVVKNSSITVLDASIKMAFKLFDAKRSEIEKEMALLKSEEKYRLISENTSDGIVHFSSNGIIDYVSPSYLKQLGYSEADEIGKDSATISPEIHPDDRDVLFSSIFKAIERKEEKLTYVYRVKHAKGHYIWREDHSKFMYDSTGAYLGAYVSCRDITERKSIENKLGILGKAIEASPAIIVVTDREGNIEYVNPKFSAVTGYSSEESIGRNPRFLKSGKTNDQVYIDLWNTLVSGNEWKGYFRNKKKSGELYYESATIAPVKNDSGEIINYIAIKEDMTEKKYMQESLEESNIRFNTLAGSKSVLVWESGIDRLCTYFNPTWLEYTGRKLEEEIGNGWAEGVHSDDFVRCLKVYNEAFDERLEFSMEYRLRKANGEYGWVLDHGSPKYHDHEFIGYIGSCIEISEIKSFENKLQHKNEEYEAINEELRSTTEELQAQNEELMQSQELLRQSETRLIQAEKIAKIGNWTLNLGTGTMIASNGADKIYGVDFLKVSLAQVQKIPLPEYRPILDKALSDLVSKNIPYDLEFKICRPIDKKIFDIHSVATFDRKTNTVFGVIQDITKQKKIELDLRDGVDRFNLLLNSVTEGIYGVDKHENCTFCNDSCLKLLGYTHQEELRGKNMHWLIHGKRSDGSVYPIEDCPIAQNFSKGIGIHIDDEVFWRSDGTCFHAEYWSNPQLQDGKVVGAVMSFWDISERKKIEEALRESEERFKRLSSFTFEGIVIHKNGIGVDANESMIEMLGYERSEIAGMNLFNIIHPDYHSIVKDKMIKQIAEPYHIIIIKKNGTTFDAEIEGKNISYNGEHFRVACIRDITERKKIESALEESKERLRFALEVSGLSEWELDLKTNKVKRNDRWAEMLGYSLAEIDGSIKQGVDLQHPDDREMVNRTVQDYYEGRTDFFKINYRMRTKSGSYKWIQDCGKTYERDAEGNPVRLCGTHADITDQKEKEEKINNLLAEKELILKEVHHRIKNNMNTISSLLSLQAGSISEPAAVIALEDAGNRIRSMSLLYDKLYRSTDFTTLSIKGYLSSLVDEVVANFPNNQNVRIEKRLEDFNLDSKRLQTIGIIVNELLTNIMKYAFIDRETGIIEVYAAVKQGHFLMSIQDNGLGMPESVSFENSTGFGLQLVQALCQQLEGSIRIERGGGTKVILEFVV